MTCSVRRPKKRTTTSSLVLLVTALLGGCDDCVPQTGVQQLQQELATTCSFEGSGVQRATKNPGSSTQPSIASQGDGIVLAWIDDRDFPASVFVQRLDATHRPIGQPLRLKTGPSPHRPQVAASGDEVIVVYSELQPGPPAVTIALLDQEVTEQRAIRRFTGPADAAHTVGLAHHDGTYFAAYVRERSLKIVEFQASELIGSSGGSPEAGVDQDASVTDANAAGDGGDGGLRGLTTRSVPLDQGIADLGNIDLLFMDEHFFVAGDHPSGWSIVIGEVRGQSVRRVAQVIDDRRNPDSRWCCPALGPSGHDHVAIMWQGPGMGLAAMYFMEFDFEGQGIGTERFFEAIVRDEENRPIGRAPAFHPSLARVGHGLIAAFADNRYANTEILLASFECRGSL